MEWLQCLVDVCQEPRELANVGLWCDMAGAILVAVTAWHRVSVSVTYGGPGKETAKPLWARRIALVAGAALLVVGFWFQIHANNLQMIEGASA